jgi:hypothetical protein
MKAGNSRQVEAARPVERVDVEVRERVAVRGGYDLPAGALILRTGGAQNPGRSVHL